MPGAADPPPLSPKPLRRVTRQPKQTPSQPGPALEWLDSAGHSPRKLLRTSWHTRERQRPSHVGRPKGDAMRLPTLKTSALPMLDSRRVTTLEAKAGATERLSGGAWETIRQRVKERDRHVCAACGRVRGDHEVDHRTPVEQGGSNDMTNLQLLCSGVGNCHDVKTRAEARQRAGGMLKV